MRKVLCSLAALAVIAAVAGLTIEALPGAGSPAVDTGEGLVPRVEAPATATIPPRVGSDCDGQSSLTLPQGVEVEAEVACCIDQCQTNFDCFFRCGGQPGECVMANPCCKECRCTVSSITSVPRAS